jgi:hypothetical protein
MAESSFQRAHLTSNLPGKRQFGRQKMRQRRRKDGKTKKNLSRIVAFYRLLSLFQGGGEGWYELAISDFGFRIWEGVRFRPVSPGLWKSRKFGSSPRLAGTGWKATDTGGKMVPIFRLFQGIPAYFRINILFFKKHQSFENGAGKGEKHLVSPALSSIPWRRGSRLTVSPGTVSSGALRGCRRTKSCVVWKLR